MSYFVTSLTCGRFQRIEWKLGNELLKAKGTVGRFGLPFPWPVCFPFYFVCLSVCFEGKQRELQASNLEANIGHKEYPRGLQMKAVYVKHITPRKGIRILKCRKSFALESEILSVGIWNLA